MTMNPPTTRRFTAPSERRRALLHKPTVVLGAGPAGLTAGYLLAKEGLPVIVLEAHEKVGGLAMTEERDGYRFDLGGHRFFTKSKEVDDLWHEVLDDEFLLRPRMSRIYWNQRFLDYPLRGPDVIRKLGPVELTPTAFGRRKLTLAPQACDHSDRSRHPQDEQRPSKDPHRRSLSDARGTRLGGASWNRTSDLILIRAAGAHICEPP